ncbi:unnamed protein product [Colletotrichum noveboracense]|uniref:Uncharacterized protein n=1 Tax=Colletotrichum noveboracense TaxID=2664923 RepID=A0A9W4WCR9_9PEZI|nr:hypothetical protein K456DRAFT_1528250 [Colletotrichum gloeosporioides 23]KAJ0287827.1 hypothetical protein COL940_002325 [Colletotrichum noveboracense]KAJ0291687.1 hypothetical protein CBS470a_003262 [Colletotrichum nupharicola]CAI0647534.1 unnamed protein product [Colletotrichum noveboracense]
MATQAIHAPAHSGHAHSSSTSSYPPQPASPTLTNPDMILPDYDCPSSPDRSHSPLMMWKNSQAVDLNMQFQFPPSAYVAGPITPATPIIYGNGTMLSDIGEVTEAESTPGKTSRPSSMIWTGRVNRIPDERFPSPTKAYESIKQRARAHERRSSVESTSTITTTQDHNVFADFDDAVSVDDSNFQGDDEESVAESYTDDVSVHKAHAISQPTRTSLNDPNRYSTALISRRAEQILANAKRRLTTMEGNLSRARSSLSISTPSMSSFDGTGSTPSPPMMRSTSSATSPSSAHGHARMMSDSSMNTELVNSGAVPRRSASAMGAAGGYRQPISTRKITHDAATLERLNSGRDNQPRYKAAQEIGLDTLGEDEVSTEFHSGSDSTTKRDSLLGPALGGPTKPPLTRSASAAQMRDLKDQVLDLKGKISSLREQARVDTMRRRSLQSLRTPSPFTHAQVDQWYAGSQKQSPIEPLTATSELAPWHEEHAPSVNDEKQTKETEATLEGPLEGPIENTLEDTPEELPIRDDESVVGDYEAAQEAVRQQERQKALDAMEANAHVEPDDDISDMHTEDGFEDSVQVQEEDGYESESGDSLYHDTYQTPVSHEDREDAFDYEHFFLHSAMGTISQQRMARQGSRRGSFSSEDSVETTRGPITSDESIRPKLHNRRGSGDTTSTMDSFATANSGRASRVSASGNEEDVRQGVLTPPCVSPISERTESPPTAKRSVVGSINGGDVLEQMRTRARAGSIAYRRPMSTQATMGHRPSTASFDSTGTNRSFPLVGKARVSVGGVLTPQGSPELELRTISDAIMSETASICDKESVGGPDQLAPMNQLAKEDQILVERFVASLGRCVLGLSESGKASAESRMYRRRLDTARKILEGMGETS